MELSVVIPTLGRPVELARALERLDAQRGAPPFEVVVVADAAEPGMDALRQVAGAHRLVQAEVAGVSAARNAGWRAATAPVVLFLGDDILAEPALLAAHAAAHAAVPAVEVAAQGHVRWADELRRSPFMEFLDEGRWQFDFPGPAEKDAGWGRLYACNLSIKRELLESVGGFDQTFTWGYEELELARRLHEVGLILRWLPQARAEHLHAPELAAWRERMRKVAGAERQMTERHPDVAPFFARRAEWILERRPPRPLHHLVRWFPRQPRVRASAFAHYEHQLASAFMDAWRAPAVEPEAYDEAYYRESCGGAGTWHRSEGREIHPLYAGSLARVGMAPGAVVVDVGTGRGELLIAALQAGAAKATGIEYSAAAVALAQQTLAAHDALERAEVLLADARALPIADASTDLVTMLDVVEHLSPAELAAALAEVLRVLCPGGDLLVHTLPSRTLYEVTYRLQRSLTPRRRRTWPADPRRDLERRMHVNEQTVSSLRRALRSAGFTRVDVQPGQWIHDDFVPDERARRLYRRLAAHRLTRRLGAADLWATARRPQDRSTR